MKDTDKIQEKVKEIIVNVLGIDKDECKLDKMLFELSADDLDVIDITMELEKEFAIAIDDKMEYPDCYDEMSVRRLVEIVKNKLL